MNFPRTLISAPARWREQRNRRDMEDMAKLIGPFVDEVFYLNAYPDVRGAGVDPAYHYAAFGWREGRDPSAHFSTDAYCARHPDIAAKGQNPLAHFLNSLATDADSKRALEDVIKVVSAEFDQDYYEAKYAEDLPEDCEPVAYFCTFGWQRGHDPNRSFSSSHYLTANQDVKNSGVNPFWHYLVAGRKEGRTPKSERCWQLDVLSKQPRLEQMKEDWSRTEAMPDLLDPSALREALEARAAGQDVLLSLSHDDYREVPGGVQLCIGHDETLARDAGLVHINLHPWQVLPTLADYGSDPILGLTVDGTSVGYARMSDIGDALSGVVLGELSLVCHHLIGHSLEGVIDLARAVGVTTCKLWLHDYFTICTSYTLMRNGVASCGAPDIGSNACTLCTYGAERAAQFDRFQHFFNEIDVHLISPSQVALDIWTEKSGLVASSVEVQPHVTLRKDTARWTHPQDFPDTYRIAFVGNMSAHKGWPVFEELRDRLSQDARFEFWVFNAMEQAPVEYKHAQAHAKSSDPFSTLNALQAAQIDLVLHWAEWPETFSFSTFEAIAAGAFVLTSDRSGNVARIVRRMNAGKVLGQPDQVYDLAANGGLEHLVLRARERRRSHHYQLEFSQMSVGSPKRKPVAA